MKSEEIDREALIAAIETELPDVEQFLDLRTGEILTIVVGPILDEAGETQALDEIARDNRMLAGRVREEPERYERVPSIAPEAAWRWMQEFASTIADPEWRATLQGILRECSEDCFAAFRRSLITAPEPERERWFAFRNEKLSEFIDEWIK
jgi:hypothetical protein